MRVIPVDDPDDPRLVELTRLNDAAARTGIESEHGCFIAEGILTLQSVLASRYPLRSVLVAEAKLHRVASLLEDVEVDVHVGPPALLEGVTGFPIHRGVIASAGRLALPDAAELIDGADRVLVVEAVNDHENLGALFRNAAAFGVDAVLLDPRCADPLYRRSVRVSLGHVLHVPWTRVEPLHETLDQLRAAGLRTLGLTPRGESAVADIDPADRLAWLVGAEGPGLDPVTLAAADARVRIPIAPGVDSLNVATAAAVALAFSSGLT